MRDCQEYREWIQAFVDGFLGPEEERELRAHVKTCAGCTAYLREMAAYRKAARSLEAEVPAALHERIMDAYYSEKRKQKRPAIIRFLQRNPFVATAAVFALVIGTVFAAGQLGNAGGAAQAVMDAETVKRGTTAAAAYVLSNSVESESDGLTGTAADTTADDIPSNELYGDYHYAARTTEAASSSTRAPSGSVPGKGASAEAEKARQVLEEMGPQAELRVQDLDVNGVWGWALVVKTDGLPSKVLEGGFKQEITADVDYYGDLVTVSQFVIDAEDVQPLLESAPGCEYTLYTDGQPWLDDQVDQGLAILLLPNE